MNVQISLLPFPSCNALKVLFPDHSESEERQYSRLHRAVCGFDTFKVETELEVTRNINASDLMGRTALSWAVRRKRYRCDEASAPGWSGSPIYPIALGICQ